MATRKLVADGLPQFEMDELHADTIEKFHKKQAADHAEAVAKLVKDRDAVIKDFSDATDAHKTAIAAKDTEIKAINAAVDAKDAEIADLKAKLAKAQAIDVDALVTEKTAVVGDAKKLAPELQPKGTAHEIRRAAIVSACADATNKAVADAVFGADGIEKASEDKVKAAFGALLALPKQAALAAQDEALRQTVGAGSASRGAADAAPTTVEVVDLSARKDILVGNGR